MNKLVMGVLLLFTIILSFRKVLGSDHEDIYSYDFDPHAETPEDPVYSFITQKDHHDEFIQPHIPEKQISTGFSLTKNIPYVEVLKLVESFVRLKGEVASRIHHLILDNSDLIKAVHNTVLSKIATLHKFTLGGIVILRKIVEFAISLFGQWSVNVDVGSSVGHLSNWFNDYSSW